jgi:hypothetical protein
MRKIKYQTRWMGSASIPAKRSQRGASSGKKDPDSAFCRLGGVGLDLMTAVALANGSGETRGGTAPRHASRILESGIRRGRSSTSGLRSSSVAASGHLYQVTPIPYSSAKSKF